MARVVIPAVPKPVPKPSSPVPDEARQDFRQFVGSAGWDYLTSRLGESLLSAEMTALGGPRNEDEPGMLYYKLGIYTGVKSVVDIINNLFKE